jgi:hypothetical protein
MCWASNAALPVFFILVFFVLWQLGSNIGLRRSRGTLAAFLSFLAPPSLSLLQQIALKGKRRTHAGLAPDLRAGQETHFTTHFTDSTDQKEDRDAPPSPWFQSVGDTVWLAEEEDASMWDEEGGGEGGGRGLTHGCLPLRALRSFQVRLMAHGKKKKIQNTTSVLLSVLEQFLFFF